MTPHYVSSSGLTPGLQPPSKGHRHLQGLHKVETRQSNGLSNLPGSLAGHSPSPSRRLPPLWLWGGVLDRLAADHTGLHSRNPICALCAGCFIDS
ncbi:hypothetical protein PVL29_010172 [Vitis rotundifolia]|uniref:Uncharacterized protein n=1 Tax=Vitis rotundifolia TaxID=103349 RepID=A0AA38ZUG4_VITRO|nr:hypothetical protein PVL29_010172 [Vitis rotundifolia]